LKTRSSAEERSERVGRLLVGGVGGYILPEV
jgi:hypothetical protein